MLHAIHKYALLVIQCTHVPCVIAFIAEICTCCPKYAQLIGQLIAHLIRSFLSGAALREGNLTLNKIYVGSCVKIGYAKSSGKL